MSDLGNRSEMIGLGGTIEEAGADKEPPSPPPCTNEEAPSAAMQPSNGEGMEIDFNQPDTCTETLTRVREGLDASGVPAEGDHVESLHLLYSSVLCSRVKCYL